MAFKKATTARHATNVKGSLALVEEAKVELEALSYPVDVSKVKVG